MEVVNGHALLKRGGPGAAVALGVFDGVHCGHQRLLTCAKELATASGYCCVAYTFDPHPATLFAPPEAAPLLIEPLATRLERFASLGVNLAVVEPFSRDFAGLDAAQYARQALADRLVTRHVVVGEGFVFGRGGTGNVRVLAELGSELGFAVHPQALVHSGDQMASSTKIRAAVNGGRVELAGELLGRPFALFGEVVRGARRGRTLGFPTANLSCDNELLPSAGVYAVVAYERDGHTCLTTRGVGIDAVVSVGYNPTFEDSAPGVRPKVEAHLLSDHEIGSDVLYGNFFRLDFIGHIREERRFSDAAGLQQQIGEDIAKARDLCAAYQRA